MSSVDTNISDTGATRAGDINPAGRPFDTSPGNSTGSNIQDLEAARAGDFNPAGGPVDTSSGNSTGTTVQDSEAARAGDINPAGGSSDASSGTTVKETVEPASYTFRANDNAIGESIQVDLTVDKPSTPLVNKGKRKQTFSKSPESHVKKPKCDQISGISDISDTELNIDSDSSETLLKKVVERKSLKGRKVQRAKRTVLSSPTKPASKLKVTKSKTVTTKPESKTRPKRKNNKSKDNASSKSEDNSNQVPPPIVNSEFIDERSGDSVGLVSVLHKLAEEMNKLSTSMDKLREDVHDVNCKIEKVTDDVNSKLEKVAEDLEKKLSHKLHNVIDSRLKKEQVKSKQEMEKEVHNVKDELSSDIACLQSQVDNINSKPQICRDLNVCIVNLAQTANENVNQIVSDLLVDGLNLRHLDFRKAERKASKDSKPGVIIVTFYTDEDRDSVLKNKSMLGNNFEYENVFISVDQSSETRIVNNNFKLLISRLGLSGLKLRGSRIVAEDTNNNRSSTFSAGQRRPVDGNPRKVAAAYNNHGPNSALQNSRSNSSKSDRGNASSGHNNPRTPRENQSFSQNNNNAHANRKFDYDRNHSSRFVTAVLLYHEVHK